MKNKTIYLVLFIYAILASLTIIYFDGTGDSGDSILHYLYAKYAPIHPELYFNHWAKPVYVLLASPFAQFGFIGVKIFNVLVSLLTIYFTFKIVQKLEIKNAILISIIFIFSPLYFILTFSGLTEPLFALFISIGIHTTLKNKYILTCLVISFLPFVRSEGLIILGVFALYFLLKKEWKVLPLLLFGHIAYSIAGYFVYHDLFWVFTKIPYAELKHTYGSGELFHFSKQLIYVIGIPIYFLFWVGIINILWLFIKKRIRLEIQILVFLGFLSFFIAHTLFWYLGIFNSMGLKRVMIGVSPLISIISLMGFNFITETFFENKKTTRLILQGLLIGYVVVFPFTYNPSAIIWNKDLSLSKDQLNAIKVSDFVSQNIRSPQRLFYAHPYLSESLNIDHFNETKRIELSKDYTSKIKSGDLIIWENWFAVVQSDVTKEQLDNNPQLINIFTSEINDDGRVIKYIVYKQK